VMISEMKAPTRLNYGRIPNLVETKDLISTQTDSFRWFLSDGLRELFDEINPITDYSGKNFELRFLDFEFGSPKFSVDECRNRDMTYAAPLRIRTRLTIRETGEIKESEVYMGDFARMTEEGTFIINGTERVVVSQLVRSPGVYFTAVEDPASGRRLFGAKLIPNRGAWLEIETSAKDLVTVKIDRKRKVPVTVLLKALELPSLAAADGDREGQRRALQELFGDVDNNPEHHYLESTRRSGPRTPSSSCTGACAPATRPASTTLARCCRVCSSPAVASTSAGSAATRSTSAWAAPRTRSRSGSATAASGSSRRVTSSPSSASSWS
jgi:DNA-directed RNA polymerase subunit beta